MNVIYYKNKIERRLFKYFSNFVYLGSFINFINKIKFYKTTPSKNQFNGIVIFYHIYLVNNWHDVFFQYLNGIIKSGLYDAMHEMHIGIIYTDESKLAAFIEEIKPYNKVTICYYRKHDDLPVRIWKIPDVEIDTNLGEGETILKMVEYARNDCNGDIFYIFLHSKGVTEPKNADRDQIEYFYRSGLSKASTNNEISLYITNKIIENIVFDWQCKYELMREKDFYYYIWNSFCVSGNLLRQFDFVRFNENAQFPCEYGLKNRHWSAIFPINLYGYLHKKRFIEIRRIIDLAL